MLLVSPLVLTFRWIVRVWSVLQAMMSILGMFKAKVTA